MRSRSASRVVGVRVERDPQRQALGVDEVVGARRADRDELLGAAREETNSSDARRGVDGEHLRRARSRPRRAARAAARAAAPARARPRRRAGRGPPNRARAARALVDERDGPVDHLDRAPVGLLGAVAPHDEPVLGEHDELEVRVRARRLADLLGEREAGADVGDPRRLVAEALAHEPLAVGACPARTLIPSGCVWWTCGAGTNACSSVSIEQRGIAGSSWQRAR